jgi:hypothetical protein
LGSTPKLLQQAQIIVSLPLLDYLASLDAVDGDAVSLYLLASGRSKLLYLSLVSTAYRPADDYPVPFCYYLLNGSVLVGESGLVPGDKLLGLLNALDVLVGFVPDEIWGVYLLEDVWVTGGFPGTTYQGLILFSDIELVSPFDSL